MGGNIFIVLQQSFVVLDTKGKLVAVCMLFVHVYDWESPPYESQGAAVQGTANPRLPGSPWSAPLGAAKRQTCLGAGTQRHNRGVFTAPVRQRGLAAGLSNFVFPMSSLIYFFNKLLFFLNQTTTLVTKIFGGYSVNRLSGEVAEFHSHFGDSHGQVGPPTKSSGHTVG